MENEILLLSLRFLSFFIVNSKQPHRVQKLDEDKKYVYHQMLLTPVYLSLNHMPHGHFSLLFLLVDPL